MERNFVVCDFTHRKKSPFTESVKCYDLSDSRLFRSGLKIVCPVDMPGYVTSCSTEKMTTSEEKVNIDDFLVADCVADSFYDVYGDTSLTYDVYQWDFNQQAVGREMRNIPDHNIHMGLVVGEIDEQYIVVPISSTPSDPPLGIPLCRDDAAGLVHACTIFTRRSFAKTYQITVAK